MYLEFEVHGDGDGSVERRLAFLFVCRYAFWCFVRVFVC